MLPLHRKHSPDGAARVR